MLYHGSKKSGIKTLKPFPHNGVDGESVVFATPDIRFAMAMIHGTGDELAVGYFVDQETHKEEMYIDELTPNALQILSAPGILYTLDDAGFVADPRLSHLELISKMEVPVVSEKYVDNILDELKKFNINFVQYDQVLGEMNKRGKDPKGAAIPYKANRFS